ncbi:hypothetical protein HPULCUR_003243 [Helicostylum pulchrum]|uniref:Uncharacterized protein n=1 Tax=Helicostylum pulchrum TaxID=562976 RepID=A0ABP9XSV1_9FUNG
MDFVYKDGNGNLPDENGDEAIIIAMEVVEEMYPIEEATSFVKLETKQNKVPKYKRHNVIDKKRFFFLIYEKGMSIRGAAKEFNDVIEREEGSGKAVGRLPILVEEHGKFLHELIDEKSSFVISEIMDEIMTKFSGLAISKRIDRAELERNVVSVTAYPNRRSQRDIPVTLEQAPRGFTPTGNNRTPSATLRIDSLITYLCAGVNRELSETQKKFTRLQFRSLARECRVNMKQNGYDFTFWN